MSALYVDKGCLFSTVRNTSGVAKTFGFLPPHGVTLAANAEYTVFGNILEAIGSGADRTSCRRNHQAFAAAMDRGDIAIVATPAPIVVSPNGTTKMLSVADNGTLSAVDPCWSDSTSDSQVPA